VVVVGGSVGVGAETPFRKQNGTPGGEQQEPCRGMGAGVGEKQHGRKPVVEWWQDTSSLPTPPPNGLSVWQSCYGMCGALHGVWSVRYPAHVRRNREREKNLVGEANGGKGQSEGESVSEEGRMNRHWEW